MADSSPMMVQYRRIKQDHRDDILFFRLGDFYEMFSEDALEVSGLLNLTLTSRNGQPMCGIPYHAARVYISRLLKLGKKIAVCEQISLPGPGKGLADRRVVEVITPGTTVDEDYLEKGRSNYLAALASTRHFISFAYIDASTGDFRACAFPLLAAKERLAKELERIQPRELIIQESLIEESPSIAQIVSGRNDLVLNRWSDWLFDTVRSSERLKKQLLVINLAGFGLDDSSPELLAAGALLAYLDETARSLLPHVRNIIVYGENDYVGLDESSQKNLELVRNLHDGSTRFTLLEVLDETKTAMGARLLRRRILHPLRDMHAIESRLDAVERLYRDQALLSALRDSLVLSYDLERLCSRVAMDRAHGKDLLAIRQSLTAFGRICVLSASLFTENSSQTDPDSSSTIPNEDRLILEELRDLLENGLSDDPSILLTEGNLIKTGFNHELDNLKRLKDNGRGALEEYLQEEREKTGINSLKIRYNRLIGYFFEIGKAQLPMVPTRFIRRQSVTGAERFTTDRLVDLETVLNGASDKVIELEKALFLGLRENVKEKIPELFKAARLTASLDVAQSLAWAATTQAWIRPKINDQLSTLVLEGRHPVVEAHLPRGEFVPNDLDLNAVYEECKDLTTESCTFHHPISFALITGPNMAGKSTYLRQAALITLMAQTGSFVPAREASIGIVDKIFCRVGASDNLARGESTFLVEMNETANILRTATSMSLVIMDEVGRGTGTNDGLSIAWAICEELLDGIKCRTLFATHYHELSRIVHPRLANRSMEVLEKDGEIVFLKKLQNGASAESYGIHVARLAGLPGHVIQRAGFILEHLKEDETVLSSVLSTLPEKKGPDKVGETSETANLRSIDLEILLDGIDPDRMTPMESLALLHEWKNRYSYGYSTYPNQKKARARISNKNEPELF